MAFRDDGKEADVKEEPARDCPFRRGKCIKGLCELWIGIMQERVVLGVRQQSQGGSCVFPALAMIMSSKREMPAQVMRMPPGIGRG